MNSQFFIFVMICASIACWLVPSVIAIVRKLIGGAHISRNRKSGMNKILISSVCLMVSVWCLRYAVAYYDIIYGDASTEKLTLAEEIANSLLHTLQTFSMDEDYTKCILDGKMMLREVFGASAAWQNLYGIYASILNFIAPVLGGALILEILANVFPKIRLALSFIAIWRPKYYFSELNEGSLALAKSICEERLCFLKKPIIIFADICNDNDKEENAELLAAAKMLGAICMKDKLVHIIKQPSSSDTVFLIDEKEIDNLSALSHIVRTAKKKFLEKATIYLFSQSHSYIEIKQRARDFLVDKRGFLANKLPKIIPIQRYRNLITNLLTSIPLYEPLICKKRMNNGGVIELNITILGTGEIGTEMFLSSYWFSQMLNVKTTINIVSNEPEIDFWSKINSLNPEIKLTTASCNADNDQAPSSLLKYNSKDYAPPYCYINYIEQNIFSDDFIKTISRQGDTVISEADYILVALGADEDNIFAANQIHNHIGLKNIASNASHKTVMAYVVYDSDLANSLNQEKWRSFKNNDVDLYMCAVGCFKDIYSRKNIFMDDFDEKIEHKQRGNEVIDADYDFWANGTRKMHRKYKAFSVNLVEKSIFEFKDDAIGYRMYCDQVIEKYRKLACGEGENAGTEGYFEILHELAWLEHRRWNAYTRIRGFKGTCLYDTQNNGENRLYEKYYEHISYKHWDLKLHPCIVECDKYGIRTDISNGKIDNVKIKKRTYDLSQEPDKLDSLSMSIFEHGLIDEDFKYWDYPFHDKF